MTAVLTVAAAVGCHGTPLEAQTLSDFVGEWSANIVGTQWDLLFEQHRQYSIWRVTADGDTLVLSLGVWEFDGRRICITPVGRTAMCGPAIIDNASTPALTEWRFRDVAGSGFGWLAYRRGYAPWDTGMPWRSSDVFGLSDVAVKPRVLGCSEPLLRPDAIRGELRILTRFVVEVDSTVSNVEVITAPSPAAEAAAARVAASCRITPGELANGRVVRVLVELPLQFP